MLLGGALTACIPRPYTSSGAGTRGIIKIGLAAPFSGPEAAIGQQMLAGARLAVLERNAAEGVAGFGVQLVAQDDEMDPSVAERRARELALDPQVVAALGHTSPSVALAARPIYEKGGLSFLSLAPGELHPPPPRLLPDAGELAASVVHQIGRRPMGRRVGFVVVEEDGFRRLAETLNASLESSGWTIVARERVGSRVLKFTQTVTRLGLASPDLVAYVGLPDQGTALAAELRRGLPDTWLAGVVGLDSPSWARAGREARILALRLSWRPDVGETPSFAARFQATLGVEATAYAALAYQATRQILEVAEVDPSRPGLAKGLAQRADGDGRLRPGPEWQTDEMIRVEAV